jgi:hypothetical protein
MLIHWATLSPVPPKSIVAIQGPSVPTSGSNLEYKAKPALVPELPFWKLSIVGTVGAVLNPSAVFDVPKAQVTRPLARTLIEEVSSTVVLAFAVPLVRAWIGFPAGEPVEHGVGELSVHVFSNMIATPVDLTVAGTTGDEPSVKVNVYDGGTKVSAAEVMCQ